MGQTGIDRKPFAANQPLLYTALHRHFENLAQQVAVTEPAMTVLGKCRVIGHIPFKVELAEPAIGKVEVTVAVRIGYPYSN